ncbi:MAG: outer membrane protein assembly factor BamA [Desulfobacterales bacterium]
MLTEAEVRASAAEAPVVDSVRVNVEDGGDRRAELESMAGSLIYLKQGEPFSEEGFARSLQALERSGLFAAVEVPDPDWTTDRIDLVFNLKPYARIKKILISGGFPLLEKEIRNVMTVDVGAPCNDEKISRQKEKVESLFLQEGYINPQAEILRRDDPEGGYCILEVMIDKGSYYRINSVRLRGNTAFSDLRLKGRLSVWQSSLLPAGASRLVEKKVREDAETIRQFYRKKGFAEAEVATGIKKNEDEKTAEVVFTISEGPRWRVELEGNTEFWDFTLKKDLVVFSQGDAGSLGLRRSIRNMEERYRKAGYHDVSIKAEESVRDGEKPGREYKDITLVISEGPKYLVESVKVSGNSAFDDEAIKAQMLTAPPAFRHKGVFDEKTLQDDIRSINALYEEAGYREVSIEKKVGYEPSGEKGDIVEVPVEVLIEEGPQTIVKDVSITGALPVDEDSAYQALEMKPGTPFRQYLVKPERDTVAAAVSEAGYPHVSVEPEVEFTEDGTGAEINYVVDPGPYVETGEVFFTGNFRTRESILERGVRVSPGEPFSLSRALETQRNIRSIRAVDTAGFSTFGLEQRADRVDMLAEIREIRPYFVELAGGYDTRRLFYMNAAAGDRNLFGLNKELRGNLELSQRGYRAELDLGEPRFFGTRISSGTGLYAEKTEELNKDFGTRIYGISQGFSRPLSSRLTSSLNFSYESRDQYRTDDLQVPEEESDEYEKRSVFTASPGLTYNSTDSYLSPTRGIRASLGVDASSGLTNSIDDFFRYRLNARYYYTPADRLTLAVNGRIGYIDPYGSEDRVAEDQLFFLGGTTDVRGFAENKLRVDENRDPVGGKTSLLASVEARYDLGMNFEAAVFYDAGAIRDPVKDAGSDDFRESAGLALRYITPIGPIGGMYGWKLDRKPGESRGAFHFSIGYTF